MMTFRMKAAVALDATAVRRYHETAVRVVSVNVGMPREVTWKGRRVTTSIFKEPVAGRVRLRTLNLDGDRQSDLSVHGGPTKAVYVYPSEHYPHWRRELRRDDLGWGMFGENLTSEGLFEPELRIGDRFRLGTAEVRVTEPRLPCYKLGLKFGDDGMVRRFLEGGRTGFYLAVEREGEVGAGDPWEPLGRGADALGVGRGLSVEDVWRLYAVERENMELLARAAGTEALPESWRSYFARRLTDLAGRSSGPSSRG